MQKTYPDDTSSFSVTNSQTGQFTFNSDTDGLCAGTYTFTLTLDSGQQFTSSALQLAIDINDQDTPRITTLALPPSSRRACLQRHPHGRRWDGTIHVDCQWPTDRHIAAGSQLPNAFRDDVRGGWL